MLFCFFLFKQKTAYEMRISDWSSDVCSSDLNGIIENYVELRAELQAKGYVFSSETDTEVIAHLIHDLVRDGRDLTTAVQRAVHRLKGAYPIVLVDAQRPDRICVARTHTPLVIGLAHHGDTIAAPTAIEKAP